MRIQKFLIVNSKGATRITKTTPELEYNEVAIKLDIILPDQLFKKPRLEAKIIVPDSAVNSEIITAETLDNIQDIIMQNSGLDLKINLVNPEKL